MILILVFFVDTICCIIRTLKGSDRQCMVIELRMSNVEYFFRIHLTHVKRFNDYRITSPHDRKGPELHFNPNWNLRG